MEISFGFFKMKTSLIKFSHHASITASKLSQICKGMDADIYDKIYIKYQNNKTSINKYNTG